MHRREERRRKFHEALLNTLYTPSPPEAEDEQKPPASSTLREDFDVDLIPDYDGLRQSGHSSSGDDDNAAAGGGGGDSESGSHKLTRAQWKRLRQKKLKEDISRRSKIIGPLLPPSAAIDVVRDGNRGVKFDGSSTSAVEGDAPGVRENADENPASSGEKPGGEEEELSVAGSDSNQSSKTKTKQRRMAKKLAKEKLLKSSNLGTCPGL